MMPRAPQCDDDRCDYDENGHWQHHPRCATRDPWVEDMATATAREDGYSLPYGTVVRLPRQREAGAA